MPVRRIQGGRSLWVGGRDDKSLGHSIALDDSLSTGPLNPLVIACHEWSRSGDEEARARNGRGQRAIVVERVGYPVVHGGHAEQHRTSRGKCLADAVNREGAKMTNTAADESRPE